MWRIGLVGTGYWSEKHLKAWSRIPNVQIAALANRSLNKLKRRAEEFGISDDKLYSSIDEMLTSDIDVVEIVTGPETHLEFVRKAASAGKHIMCQKPFASSLDIAEEIVATADLANVRLMVTENWRWLEPFQFIKNVLNSQVLGKIRVVRYIHTDFYTPRMAPEVTLPQPFFRTMPQLLFYEMGCHWFDTWRFLFGDPKRLYAEYLKVSPYVIGEDTDIVTLGYDDFYGYLDMSWATRRNIDTPLSEVVGPEHRESLVIEGSTGTLKLYETGRITMIDNHGTEKTLKESSCLDHEESHFRLQSHFIECLDSGREFQTSGKDNLNTLRLVFGAYQSAKEHVVIQF